MENECEIDEGMHRGLDRKGEGRHLGVSKYCE